MDKKYFICIKPGIKGDHIVHNADCPFLPYSGNRICLGHFNSSKEAEKAGRLYFKKTSRCPFCSSIRSNEVNSASGFLFGSYVENLTFENLIPEPESAFVCGTN